MSDRETWDPEDPWYDQRDGHIVSGDGVYCPEEALMYEPKKSDGSECPLCGYVREATMSED